VEQPRKWRWGKYRWFLLLFMILGFILARYFPPLMPHIQLPAEPLVPLFGSFSLTNTMVAMLIADAILLLIGWRVYRTVSGGALIPKGITGTVEALLEVLFNLTESTAGKWAKTIFPFFATITLLVLVVNWTELIPGVDSIGIFNSHHVEAPEACKFNEWIPGIVAVGGAKECVKAVVPFVRVTSTDLNFTIALALIAVTMTQWLGIKAQGGAYLKKFINTSTFFSKPIFGVIDFGVGLLEMVSEFSKILSFSFRLFGNIFAGSVLLFVIGSLVPVFAQSMFLMLEFFVGLIQAIVFGMLTMVFMSQATQGHAGGQH
jgi:F-type H+-transporting ATPase subunit a